MQVALLGAARAAHVLFVTAPIKHAAPEGHIHLWHWFEFSLPNQTRTLPLQLPDACSLAISTERRVLGVWVEFHRLLWHIPEFGTQPQGVQVGVQIPAVARSMQGSRECLTHSGKQQPAQGEEIPMSFCCAVLPGAAQQNPAALDMAQPLHWGSTAGRVRHELQELTAIPPAGQFGVPVMLWSRAELRQLRAVRTKQRQEMPKAHPFPENPE